MKKKEQKTVMSVEIPVRLKRSAEDEAARRGITLSALVKNYLANFLPENIDRAILNIEEGIK